VIWRICLTLAAVAGNSLVVWILGPISKPAFPWFCVACFFSVAVAQVIGAKLDNRRNLRRFRFRDWRDPS
jgi:hypothetical protein